KKDVRYELQGTRVDFGSAGGDQFGVGAVDRGVFAVDLTRLGRCRLTAGRQDRPACGELERTLISLEIDVPSLRAGVAKIQRDVDLRSPGRHELEFGGDGGFEIRRNQEQRRAREDGLGN